MGVQLSWLKRTTYNCDTDGSNPSAPTKIMEKHMEECRDLKILKQSKRRKYDGQRI